MFCIILGKRIELLEFLHFVCSVVSKSSKNRIDGLLRTIADAGMIGKKFYVKPKRKSAKQKCEY
jgi:hypothetical protein